jgi:hypothetical protein
MLQAERFDDVEPSLQQAEKYLEGLPAAEKDPIVKMIAEVRAKIEPAKAPDILVAGAPRPDDQSVAPRTETATSTETPTSPAVQPESNEAAPAFDGQPPIPSARSRAWPSLATRPRWTRPRTPSSDHLERLIEAGAVVLPESSSEIA